MNSEGARIQLEPQVAQYGCQEVALGLAKQLEVNLWDRSAARQYFSFVRVEVRTMRLKSLVLGF
jgi:hypothetical protein